MLISNLPLTMVLLPTTTIKRYIPFFKRYLRIKNQRRRQKPRLTIVDFAIPTMLIKALLTDIGNGHIQSLEGFEDGTARDAGWPVRLVRGGDIEAVGLGLGI